MKPIIYLSSVEKTIYKEFSTKARLRVSNLINMICAGLMPAPHEFKYMPTVGSGVYEIRVKAEKQYRVFYISKFDEAVYIIHAFNKKTQKTSQKDIDIAKDRYKSLLNFRGKTHG